jgi:hypothetical protein
MFFTAREYPVRGQMIRLLFSGVPKKLFPLTRKTEPPTKNKRLHLDEIAKFLFSRSEPLVISFINAGFGMNYDPATVSLRPTTTEYFRNFNATRADIVLVATSRFRRRSATRILRRNCWQSLPGY